MYGFRTNGRLSVLIERLVFSAVKNPVAGCGGAASTVGFVWTSAGSVLTTLPAEVVRPSGGKTPSIWMGFQGWESSVVLRFWWSKQVSHLFWTTEPTRLLCKPCGYFGGDDKGDNPSLSAKYKIALVGDFCL